MFGLGMGEVVIILILALVLLGPQKLPEAAKQLGKGLREFRRATEDLKNQFEAEMNKVEEAAKPAAPKPTLVPGSGAPPATGDTAPVPYASADNVPGLESVSAAPEPGPAAGAESSAAAPSASPTERR